MHFGRYSLLLLLAAANGALLAALLVSPIGRHRGSRALAALVAAIALRTAPYFLGFAGAYDLHPWLTFAPFDLTLAWGPLLWIYVHQLAQGAPPERWQRHLVPAALQLVYQLTCFALPLQTKWAWYTGAHLQRVEPLGVLAVLASLGLYAAAAWRRYEQWQQWLDENLSNRESSRLGWLRAMLVGMAATASLGAVMTLVHLTVRPLDYFARLPIMIALAALTYLIGLLGIRFGREAIPMDASAAFTAGPASASASAPPSGERTKDYREQAKRWRAQVLAQRWHHDPQLTLTTLAQRLDTSPRTLSRTLNDGLGESFNTFVNALRVDDAVARLRQPGAPDVLRVALDVGFSSKASFNRAFRSRTGTTPSAVRSVGLPEPAPQVPPNRSLAHPTSTD